MAVEVTLHENPFENLVVWEKQSPISTSKHRNRTYVENIDSVVVIKDDNGKDEFHTDYCFLAAAAKEPSSQQHGRSRPVMLSDRDNPHSNCSTGGYNTFARTHISGPVYEERKLSASNPRLTLSEGPIYGSEIHDDQDLHVFCCDRDIDYIIDCATCMCCVKGAIYHCTKDSYDEGNIAIDPCTCEQETSIRACVSRWACMALCSLFLPCILCYLPTKGCVQVCTCYKQHRTANDKIQKTRIKEPH